MSSPLNFSIDDKDLDDAELWAVIDSAAASHSSTKPRKPLTLLQSSSPLSPPPSKSLHSSFNLVHSPNHHSHKSKSRSFSTIEDTDSRVSPNNGGSGEILQESSSWSNKRSPKRIRMDGSGFGDENNRMIVVNQNQNQQVLLRTPKTSPVSLYSSPDCGGFNGNEISPVSENSPGFFQRENFGEEMMVHSLSGRFPSVSLFKEYQNKAMAILEKSDWTMISGSPYIKKSGWRKIAFYFNVSFEIKDKSIELDENRNVQRAEFTVRAHMQGGRFSDGWGSCERREKRFMKPNQDIPSTAETRAKNKACQDLLGIGQYRSGT